jgi:hypothetical protein
MRAVALLAALAWPAPAAAQGQQDGCGPRESLKLVQETPGAALFSDRGFGTPASPRRYCLAWKGLLSIMDEPMLVFVTPSDGKYPDYPRSGVTLSRLPISEPKQTLENPLPYNVWTYPTLGPDMTWGMYAAVWNIDEAANTALSVRPIMWWGRLRGQSFDSVPAERVNDKVRRLKLPAK